ncbi:MAG: DMT family transporter [Lysobacteraceae bacterium]
MNFGLGEALSLASAAAWAVGVILYRRLGESLPPLTLCFLKNLLVLGMLVPIAVLLHGPAVPVIPWPDVLLALASGVVGIAVADTLYFKALNALGAARMGVIGNLYSPFVIVLGVLVLGERLGLLQLLGFALVMAGVALVSRPARPAPATTERLAGEVLVDAAGGTALPPRPQPGLKANGPLLATVLGVVAIALMAVAIIMVKRTLEEQPLGWITLLRVAGAIGGLLVIAAFRGGIRARLWPGRGRVDWRRLAIAAAVGQCLAMLLWLGGYKYTDASIAAVLNETASVFIVILAWLWLREPLGRRAIAGVALTLAGVVVMLGPGG